MIVLPRRSVTRFFIPLIDVLTLLFCIYLIMPIVDPVAETEAAGQPSGAPLSAVERRKETPEALQNRLALQLLEIGEKGKLYSYPVGKSKDHRLEITEANVGRFRERTAREHPEKETYFLILVPSPPGGNPKYPSDSQLVEYERWFKEAAHGYAYYPLPAH